MDTRIISVLQLPPMMTSSERFSHKIMEMYNNNMMFIWNQWVVIFHKTMPKARYVLARDPK